MSEERFYWWFGVVAIMAIGLIVWAKAGFWWWIVVTLLSLLNNSAGICEGQARATAEKGRE